jgi:hypothetical protein
MLNLAVFEAQKRASPELREEEAEIKALQNVERAGCASMPSRPR